MARHPSGSGAGRTPRRLKAQQGIRQPELFATYVQLVAESRDVVVAHVKTLTWQLAAIITRGVQRGEFEDVDPTTAARAVFDATARFHNPVHATEWSDPGIDAAFEGV